MSKALEKTMQSIRDRIYLMLGRAVLNAITEGGAIQLVHFSALKGEVKDSVQRLQQYGSNSVPLPGALVLFASLNGNRDHPVAICVDDQRFRPTDWVSGDAGSYNYKGTIENILAKVITMASHELHGFIDYVSRQILPITAVDEWLERHSSTWRIVRKAAAPAKGKIQFTGTNGSVIPAGAIVRRSDDVEFTVDADVTIAGGVALADITAVSPALAGNSIPGTKVSLTSPIAGVISDALVQAGGLSQGAEIEDDDALRGRLLARIQQPPHGGAGFDYEAWALEVAGVTRAWVYPNQYGLGTVGVIFVMDNKIGTIIPSAGEVEAVQDHIDLNRPVTADVTVIAPTPVAVNLEIHISPNTLTVQNAIKAELEDFFRRESVPGGILYFSRLNEAVSAAAGEFDHIIVTPSANIVRTYGQISQLGTITWDTI